MLVYNPTSEKHNVKALGKWFDFQKESVKSVSEEIGQFLIITKSYLGFVPLPDICAEQPNSPEAVEAKENARKSGLMRRISYLNGIVKNHEISLRMDLDKNNDSSSVDAHITPGVLAAYKELSMYRGEADDSQAQMAAEAKALREKLAEKK